MVASHVYYGTKSSLSEGETMGGDRARSLGAGSHLGPGLPGYPGWGVSVFIVAA